MFGKNDSLKRIGLTIATAGLVNTSESYIISIRLYMIRKKCEEPIRLAFGKNGIILRILDVRSLPVRSSHCKWREDGPISDDQEQGWVYTHKHIKYYFVIFYAFYVYLCAHQLRQLLAIYFNIFSTKLINYIWLRDVLKFTQKAIRLSKCRKFIKMYTRYMIQR